MFYVSNVYVFNVINVSPVNDLCLLALSIQCLHFVHKFLFKLLFTMSVRLTNGRNVHVLNVTNVGPFNALGMFFWRRGRMSLTPLKLGI